MNADKRLFAQLTAFLAPVAAAAGLKMRPFSINLFSMTRMAGLCIGTEEFAKLPLEENQRQLSALLVIQTTEDIVGLGRALRAANGDLEKFYWDFVFAQAVLFPMEALAEVAEQLGAEMPAIEAAQVEVLTPPSMKGGEKPPPNS